MLLLDASVLVAFLTQDSAADRIGELLRERESAIATVNLAEVIDVLGRRAPSGFADARRAIEPLLAEVISARPLSEAIAWRAAELRIAHYHRQSRPLSMADCVLLASLQADETLASTDSDVIAIADASGYETVNPRAR